MMRPISEFSAEARRAVKAVLTDIDGTLTDDGRLPAGSYAAMEKLKQAGLIVIPVTGRPAGWCDLIARQWPVDGVVGENGAFYFAYDDATRRMTRVYAQSLSERRANRVKLDAICEQVLREVPGSAVSADQAYREADLAIDFCEDVVPLPRRDVEKIVEIFNAGGATAKVSSIHVNGWFGGYDKLSMSRRILDEQSGILIDRDNHMIVFAGDSPNDSPMFGFFRNSIGVANVRDFEDRLSAKPAWVTDGRGAQGFSELAGTLLEVRR